MQSPMFFLWGAVGLSCVIIGLLISILCTACSLPCISRAEMIAADTAEFVEEEAEKLGD